VLRIHSEIFWSLALAAAVIRSISSELKRTGRMRPLAVPFGSFGLPIFFGLVGFGTVSELLNDSSLYGCSWRYHGRNMEYGHMSLRLRWFPGLRAFAERADDRGLLFDGEVVGHAVIVIPKVRENQDFL
jgi:hypothetical protein